MTISKGGFPNLAGPKEIVNSDSIVHSELEAAGIDVFDMTFISNRSEVQLHLLELIASGHLRDIGIIGQHMVLELH